MGRFTIVMSFGYASALSLLGVILMVCCTSLEEDQKNSTGLEEEFKFSRVENSGVKFRNTIQETEQMNHLIWESIYAGAGVGIGDFNNDGLKDIYFCSNFGKDKIYINQGELKFLDITKTANVNKSTNISSGVVIADINLDGYLDLYVSKYGPSLDPKDRSNELYINNGDLTFTESASKYGLDNGGNTIQSTFFDYNKDGLLDLYVLNQPSHTRAEKAKYYSPDFVESDYLDDDHSDCLFKNIGNGQFENVSRKAGIRNFSFGLSVIASDINNDGWTDIFISNDYEKPDLLYMNQKDGTFSEIGKDGFDHMSNFSMGADIEDINGDLLPDIFVLDMAAADHFRSKTNMPSMRPKSFWSNVEKGNHFQYMHNNLHMNEGSGRFSERSYLLGLSKTDWSHSTLINDLNNDSFEDIYITNGIYRDVRNNDFIKQTQRKLQTKDPSIQSYMDIVKTVPSNPVSNYLFTLNDKGVYSDIARSVGLGAKSFSNGCAYADLDNDGDLDIIVNNVNQRADIFENNASDINNSLRIALRSSNNKNPVLNTKVTLYADDLIKRKELLSARGYMSISEKILHFGLGNRQKVDSVVITWPDLSRSVVTELELNTENVIDIDTIEKRETEENESEPKGFFKRDHKLNSEIVHIENVFDDFEKQVLLPYKLSEMGPILNSGDLNGDGTEDLIVGSSVGQKTSIYFSGSNGSLTRSELRASDNYEDCGIELFDADNDGDLDLFISSGGYQYEEGNLNLKDRLYINDGKGKFVIKDLKCPLINSGNVVAMDHDSDGDQDLFVFGRVLSGKYPLTPESYILENIGDGLFEELSRTDLSFLKDLGMVTDAIKVPFEEREIIALVGEYLSPKILSYQNDSFELKDLDPDLKGIWFGIGADDLDGDGDQDLILGNIGKNIKFKASMEKPFKVYANDFDNNGTSDIVLTSYYKDNEVPARGRECSSEQLPELTERFKSYESFANATISDIIDVGSAQLLQATTLSSGILWNNGDSNWLFEEFPDQAQVSPLSDFEIIDINRDGQKDIIACGNLYGTEVETTRLDGGKGLLLLQNNKKFEAVPARHSGLYAKGDSRKMKIFQKGLEKYLIITMNNGPAQFFLIN